MLITVVLGPPSTHTLRQFYPLCSRLWVMHINSLATPFLTLFLTSPCPFCTYQLVLFNSCTFSPIIPIPSSNHLSSYPWVVHISSLALHFLYYSYSNLPLSSLHLPFMLLIPCTFSLVSPLPLPADNPPCDLHFCESVPVLVVCLGFFFFF